MMTIHEFAMTISGKDRMLISVSSPEPVAFNDLTTIITPAFKNLPLGEVRVYTTEGYIFKTFEPDDKDPYYTYWFILKDDQSAAQAQADLLNANAAYAEALDTIEYGIQRQEAAE